MSDNLIRGWRLRRDNFHHNMARHLREMVEIPSIQASTGQGRPLLDLADYISSLSVWSQELTTLETLVRSVSPNTDEFTPLQGGELVRTLAVLATQRGAPSPHESLPELVLAAALDVESHQQQVSRESTEAHARTEVALEKAERRILQLEGVEAALIREKATTDDLREQLAQVVKDRDYLAVFAPEQEEVSA